MLKIEKLAKSFHKNTVLNELDFQVKQGDLIYIHGINGSGKSTLFKIICGILEPDKGTVIKDPQIHIGALIENPGFIENESIYYNLHFLASLKHHYDEQRIIQLCQMFYLDYQSKGKLKDYSLGMRQKTGIIQAIMEDQNFILLDEPTRGLDEESVDAFCLLINQLNKEGKTIIIAAHDYLKQIHYNHTYHLKDGNLIQDEIS